MPLTLIYKMNWVQDFCLHVIHEQTEAPKSGLDPLILQLENCPKTGHGKLHTEILMIVQLTNTRHIIFTKQNIEYKCSAKYIQC